METAQLKAEARSGKGTRSSFNFRREGRLPAVIYGEGKPPEMILVDTHEFEGALRHHVRVLDINLAGKSEKVLVHDVQWNDMGDRLNHVDFLRIAKDAKVEVAVELEFVGHPKGLSKGGEFVKQLSDLQIRCAPEAIPGSVKILVTDLDLDESIYIKDLDLPDGVVPLHEADDLVCVIHTRAVVEEEVTEGEEGAEGESAEPEVISKGKSDEGEPSED